jgi:hypothetical protein
MKHTPERVQTPRDPESTHEAALILRINLRINGRSRARAHQHGRGTTIAKSHVTS